MIRIIAFLVGIGFVAALLVGALMPRDATEPTVADRFHEEHKELSLASDGPLGKYDRAQLQRGFQVYKEVCSSCHSMRLVAFNDLTGIGYSEGQIKTLAAGWSAQTPSVNEATGEAASRPSIPSDKIPSPYLNDVAGRQANNGALPPDLSLMTKAREGGAAYVYSLLTGYQKPPANLPKDSLPDATHHYNPYFAALNIAMPPPLTAEGQVSYDAGGPKPTVDQMAKDVSAFLVWTAEPKLENRHRAGLGSMIFLLFFAVFAWLSYQNIWADKKH
jgi:ubiquinol-cytochrome c reductase cytochrome c1 subunit